MQCEVVRSLIHGYVDGELEPGAQAELRAHLASCASCAQQVETLQALRGVLASRALRYPAPAALRQRIAQGRISRRWPPRLWSAALPGLAVAASWLAVGLVSWNLALRSPGPAPAAPLSEEVVASHIRALMVDHAVDVASSDHHSVRPWFTGKLDFAPRVPDISRQGFALVGGRLDYLGGKAVAALVYQRRRHTINLFVGPVSAAPQTAMHGSLSTLQGFHIVQWQDSGMGYWAVSDLNPGELQEFARLVGRPDG